MKEVASIEADAPVEAAEGKTSDEPVASTEDKVNPLCCFNEVLADWSLYFHDTNQVVAEIEAVTAAEIAPVTNSSSAPAEVFISSM